MTGSHLTEIREMIEAAAAKAGVKVVEHMDGAGHVEPEHVYSVLHGQPIEGIPFHAIDDMAPETHIDPGVARHYEQMRQEKKKLDDDAAAWAAIPIVPCPWICPAACRECPIENCTERLDGGNDAK